MKAIRTGTHPAAPARRGRLVDFLFVGLGVVPLVLLLGGLPGVALLLFIPLLFAACLLGMWEQIGSESGHSADGGDASGQLGGKPPAAGISLRKEL